MHSKLNVDVTAMDTTQARITQQDVGNIENPYFEYRFTIPSKRLKPHLPEN